MKQFEALTKYIDIFEEHPVEIIYTHTDVDEGFLQAEHNRYSPYVESFMNEVMQFTEEHPELKLTDYNSIIDSFEKVPGTIRQAEGSVDPDYLVELDAKGVLAWIVSAVRAEAFRPGALYDSIRKGIVKIWLSRLSELDR